MEFCPVCGTLLQIESQKSGYGGNKMRFSCQVCPYVCEVQGTIKRKAVIKQKASDPVQDMDAPDVTVSKTTVTCQKCGHGEAYYVEMQTRSADEGSTLCYTCCNKDCGYQWRDNN